MVCTFTVSGPSATGASRDGLTYRHYRSGVAEGFPFTATRPSSGVVRVYTRALSDAEIARVLACLKAEWGTA